MNPWLVYPTWQNFSSVFREIVTADLEPNQWLKSHHLTAALYFSISFIEALLNEKYRARLELRGVSETEIMRILRRGSSCEKPKEGRTFEEKFSTWPSLICGKEVKVSETLKKTLSEFNDLRGSLTHPKSRGHEIYDELERVDLKRLLESIAEYAVEIHSSLGELYPYWLFGWNYLNANGSGFDPLRINDQQFLHSLDYLGLNVPAFDADAARAWKETHFRSFDSYKRIAAFLAQCPPCEPFDPEFPLRPRLVRTWWDTAVFEKHKDFIKRRSPPIIFGTVTVAPMFITPISITAKPAS